MTVQSYRFIAALAQHKTLFTWLAIAVVVFIAYFNTLKLSFYGDDWIFYELAGRLSLSDYLVKYFDPRVQTAWYRPVQGVLFRVEYILFGADPLGYHLLNVLFHLANCYWVFGIVNRVARNRQTAFIAALIFATLPTAALAVFWPGVVDTFEAFFYLASVWFWLEYLQSARGRDYGLALAALLLALFSKEIGVMLPITLFLIDRCAIAQPTSLAQLVRRYVWFGLAWLGYFAIEYVVTRRSVFISREGYTPGLQFSSNLLDYLSALAFPWLPVSLTSYVWLLIVVVVLAYLVIVRKVYALCPVIVGAILAVLPVMLFPFVTNRFLYLSLAASAILYAALFDWMWRWRPRWAYRIPLLVLVGVLTMSGSASISSAAVDFSEWARVSRVPFRNVSQAHPTFPNDSLVYFINPPLPGPNLSGMFFWRYGPSVVVRADDMNTLAGLRDHAAAFVDYFDEQGNQHELIVEKELSVRATPALPVVFSAPIQLEGYELVSANVKPDQPIILFLYWRALDRMERDYTVLVQLIDPSGKPVAGYDKEPRRGKAPTRRWTPGESIADVIQLPITQVPPGIYRLAVGLFDVESSKRLSILDSAGQVVGDQIIIEPLRVAE